MMEIEVSVGPSEDDVHVILLLPSSFQILACLSHKNSEEILCITDIVLFDMESFGYSDVRPME